MAYFRGGIDRVIADLAVVEGDQDPVLTGPTWRRLLKEAGELLAQATAAEGRRQVGELRCTPGFGLPCTHLAQVVHTRGVDLQNLAQCYARAFAKAEELKVSTVAFDLLGTSLYHRPQVPPS
jgi:O-acetyl-ADP-ribose deacetylase (regulator of RNase III)